MTWLLCREPENNYFIVEAKNERIGIAKTENAGIERTGREEQYSYSPALAKAADNN
jgi:hypothetical protein